MTKLNHERPNLKLANNFKKLSSLATDQNSNIVSHSADYSSLPGEYKGLNVSSEQMAKLITSYVRSDLARHKLLNAKSGAVVGKKVKHSASRYDFNLAELSREFRPLMAQILIEITEENNGTFTSITYGNNLVLDHMLEKDILEHFYKNK